MVSGSHCPPTRRNPLIAQPVWIEMDGEHIRVEGEEQISLACQLACLYHNGPDCRAPPEDGWAQDTMEIEEKAMQHMLAEASDEDWETEVE